MRRALLIAALALWPSLALAQFNGGGGISNSGGVQVNGGVAGNVAAYSNAGTIGPNSGITFSGSTPTITAGTLSGITTLPGSGNSIDASGDVIGTYFKPTGAIAASGPSVYSSGGQLAFGVNGNALASYANTAATIFQSGNSGDVTAAIENTATAVNTSARAVLNIGGSSSGTTDGQIIVNGQGNSSGNGIHSVNFNATAGTLNLATGGANAITISTGQAVGMPALASSSAAQTGTVCWTTGGGNLTVDTTVACLASSARFKMNDRPLDIGLDAVMKLRPVAYELRPEFNPMHLGEQVGLMAEAVGEVDDRLIAHDPDGEARGVRYMQLTAVLVRAVQEQQAQIAALSACRLRVMGHCWF